MLAVYLMLFLLAFSVAKDATHSHDTNEKLSVESRGDNSPESHDSQERPNSRRVDTPSPRQK
ncbi:hypothetical protein OSTOST_03374 [Ostertagia ostertagi]